MICVVLGGRVVRWGLDRKRERERKNIYGSIVMVWRGGDVVGGG